jgi:hypothetical protein
VVNNYNKIINGDDTESIFRRYEFPKTDGGGGGGAGGFPKLRVRTSAHGPRHARADAHIRVYVVPEVELGIFTSGENVKITPRRRPIIK